MRGHTPTRPSSAARFPQARIPHPLSPEKKNTPGASPTNLKMLAMCFTLKMTNSKSTSTEHLRRTLSPNTVSQKIAWLATSYGSPKRGGRGAETEPTASDESHWDQFSAFRRSLGEVVGRD
jgi:hypothetical protein